MRAAAAVTNPIYSETMLHLHSGMPFTEMFAELNRFLIEDIYGSGSGVRFSDILGRDAEWDVGVAWNKLHESAVVRNSVQICVQQS
jgi:hypothetical protein